jgi:hypothetical protein
VAIDDRRVEIDAETYTRLDTSAPVSNYAYINTSCYYIHMLNWNACYCMLDLANWKQCTRNYEPSIFWINKIWVSKRLGKWKTKQNKTTQGLGNKNLLSFPKHDSLKYWRLKSNVTNHMSIQYVNQSEPLSWSFSRFVRRQMVSPKKYICRQHETSADNTRQIVSRRYIQSINYRKINSLFSIKFWPCRGKNYTYYRNIPVFLCKSYILRHLYHSLLCFCICAER